ncbi:MAG TPA: septal ring lytic transglycosylase RlpA family protein [Candidatus Dormibacteraeota bacterium]|nr:septal ring lytic transglycosylase RlpA family protein [Candidatus Dormibacteraeota bacterium]
MQSCSLVLGHGTPAQPKPHECWHAVASWYGPQFEGRPTADGTTFNMYAATAAHRSLPLGSVVRVSNPSTGRSMVVTINDRGPYVPGRGLDVSYEVAHMLGFAQRGLCRVEIELLRLPDSDWIPDQVSAQAPAPVPAPVSAPVPAQAPARVKVD